MQSLSHPSGTAEQDVTLALAPSSHALELPSHALQGVAEPEVLAVVASRQLSGVVLVHHVEEPTPIGAPAY